MGGASVASSSNTAPTVSPPLCLSYPRIDGRPYSDGVFTPPRLPVSSSRHAPVRCPYRFPRSVRPGPPFLQRELSADRGVRSSSSFRVEIPRHASFHAAYPLPPSKGGRSHVSEAVSGRYSVTEPILVPKLRIRFADFPYLHWTRPRGCSPWRPDAVFGTVRHGRVLYHPPGFSRSVRLPKDPTVIHGALALSTNPYPCLRTKRFAGRWSVNQNR